MAKALIDLDNIIRCEKCGQRLNEGQVECPVCKEPIDLFERTDTHTTVEKNETKSTLVAILSLDWMSREQSFILWLTLLLLSMVLLWMEIL